MKKTDMSVLHIKNMVCPRCIKVVSEELDKLHIPYTHIELGKAELSREISGDDLAYIKTALRVNGFELLDDRRTQLIEQIKRLIIEGIRKDLFSEMNINLSQYISDCLHMDYSYLSNLFSSVEGKSIERFVILQKTERIKELISYDELSIKEIADQLGYSSLQALSAQFKKETGMTPTGFKKLTGGENRKPISGV